MPNLFELSEELYDWTEDCAGDPDSEVLELIEGMQGQFEDKVEGICGLVKQLISDAAAYKVVEQSLTKKRKAIENKVERLKQYAADAIVSLPPLEVDENGNPSKYPNFKRGLFKMRVQKNPLSFDDSLTDLSLVPDAYQNTTTVVTIDKKFAMEQLKATGEVIPGLVLNEAKWSLRIQ